MLKRISCVAALVLMVAGSAVLADEAASKLAEPQLGVKLSAAKNVVTAGENFDLHVTLKNLSDREATVSPLQPFAFLRIVVESEGKLLPSQVKVLLSPEPDVALRPAQQIQKELDIGTWFPLGLYAGSFKIHFSYQPDQNRAGMRAGMIESNVVEVEVKARTAEQENEYQDFVTILRASRDKVIERCEQFLKQHKGSMFEPRVRLALAARYGAWKQFEKVHESLGTEFAQASPTKREQIRGLYFRTRAFRESGKLQEALTLAESVDEYWAKHEARLLRGKLRDKQKQGGSKATEDVLPDKPQEKEELRMGVMRWVVGIVLAAVFVWVSSLNWMAFWKGRVRKRRAASWIPLLGGVCGTISFLMLPIPSLGRLWMVPLIVDWGCLPGIVDTIVFHLLCSKKSHDS